MDALGESAEERRNIVLWKTIKAQVPYVVVIPIVAVFLPWNQHWFRCLVVLGVMLLPAIWGACFQYRRQIRPLEPRHSRLLNLIQYKPLLGIPIAMILAGGAAAAMCLLPWLYSYFLIVFLHPDWPAPRSSAGPFLHAAGYVVVLVILLSAPVALLVAFREGIFPKRSVLEKIIPLLARMRLDPEKLMKETYAELMPLLQLDPDRERQLKDLIWKSSVAAAKKTIPLITPGHSPAKRQALREALQSERALFEEQTRLLLGEQGYETFKQFGKTVPDRTFVQDFNKRLRRAGHELSHEEAWRFREALTQARANFPWTTELGRRDHDPASFLGQFTQQNAEVFAKEEEEFDRQFRVIALGLLTAPQFNEFQSFQARRRRSQSFQMKLAAKSLA